MTINYSKIEAKSNESLKNLSDGLGLARLINELAAHAAEVGNPHQTALSALTDLLIQAPQIDDMLYWNGTKWVNKANSPLGVSDAYNLWLTNVDSDVTGYLVCQSSPSSLEEEILNFSVTEAETKQLLAIWATPENVPKRTTVDVGTWISNLYVSSGNVSTQLTVDIYKRTEGGTETLLVTGTSVAFSNDDLNKFEVVNTQQAVVTMNETDRIVVKLSATCAATAVISMAIQGTNTPSYVKTPFTLKHNELGGLQGGAEGEYYHLTEANAAVVAGITSALDGKEATANKTTAWSETPGNTKFPTEKLVKDNLDAKNGIIDRTPQTIELTDNAGVVATHNGTITNTNFNLSVAASDVTITSDVEDGDIWAVTIVFTNAISKSVTFTGVKEDDYSTNLVISGTSSDVPITVVFSKNGANIIGRS